MTEKLDVVRFFDDTIQMQKLKVKFCKFLYMYHSGTNEYRIHKVLFLEEYALFKQYHPHTLSLAIASTGAAAGIVYKQQFENVVKPDARLKDDYAYMALFKDLLRDVISSS